MRESRGFTLLEVCLSIALFAVMMEGLMLFTAQMTKQYNEFKKIRMLEIEAVTIQDFIKDYVRTADKLKIVTEEAEKNPKEVSQKENPMVKQRLKAIEGTFWIANQNQPNGVEIKKCKISLSEIRAEREGKGTYKLTYAVLDKYGLSINSNLISEMIENIWVYQDEEAAIFECIIKQQDEENEKLQASTRFMEVLKYKLDS